MARPKTSLLTDRESEIMAILWKLETATAEDIRGRLTGKPHDSSVRTILRVLVSKGHVVADAESRPTTYRPRVQKTAIQTRAIRDLLKKFFAGSAEDLVLHLLDDERLSAQQLQEIQAAYRRSQRENQE